MYVQGELAFLVDYFGAKYNHSKQQWFSLQQEFHLDAHEHHLKHF